MGKRRTIGLMVIVFFVWNGVIALSVDPDYYVSPNGDDGWNGEYATYQEGLNGPKATIQAGINVAGSGSAGSYKVVHILNNEGQGCTYNVNSTISLDQYNYQEIVFYENVLVEGGTYFDSDPPPATYRPLFKVERVHNIRFRGYEGATFRMTKRPGHTTYNGCHAIRLNECISVDILGLTLEKSRGDGICITYVSKNDPAPCESIEISDVDCDDNCRNAISVESIDGLLIEDCILRNTSGATEGPCAGIKIEPATSSDILKGIVVRDTTISGNDGGGGYKQLGVSLHNLEGNPEPVDILFETVTVTDGPGIQVFGIRDNGPEGSIEFKDLTVESTHYCVRIRRKSYFGEPVCETIVAGDINGDCRVGFADFGLMALHWLEEN